MSRKESYFSLPGSLGKIRPPKEPEVPLAFFHKKKGRKKGRLHVLKRADSRNPMVPWTTFTERTEWDSVETKTEELFQKAARQWRPTQKWNVSN